MSMTIEALVASTTYQLSGGSPYWFIGMTGAGLPRAKQRTSRGFGQVGATSRGRIIEPRTVRLVLMFNAATLALADSYRDQLTAIFRPLEEKPIKLRATRDDGAIRQLDCYTNGDVDYPVTLQDRMGTSQRVIVELLAPNPIWYNPTAQAVYLINPAALGWDVPMDVPWAQAASTDLDQSYALTYLGDWQASPELAISGPITDAIVTNQATGEVLDFTGATIADGTHFVVTTGYGAQGVVDNSGTNQIAKLTAASDLSTFHLAPNPEAAGGINVLTVSGSSVGANTRVVMRWNAQYASL